MRAITIKQPWASLIVEGIKDVENRTWRCPQKYIGKRVLVHAGMDNLLKRVKYGDTIQFMTPEQIEYVIRTYERNLAIFGTNLPTGAIIGSVKIVDCVVNHESIWAEQSDDHQILTMRPIYNWVLANPIKFPEPIPCKGKLSFWEYPNILAETEEENWREFCHCQIPVKLENQVMPMGDGTCRCRYCGGLWYK